jgi:hypothetical protein
MVLLLAAPMYFFRLGSAGLDDAEAYSAYIAGRTSLHAVLDANRRLDPGKSGGLYVLALHWYCAWFGTGEVALRAFSAVFGLACVTMVFALAAELFGTETALIAAALWAFNPLALIVARWARMYSMFIALTLASLFAMRKVQRRPNAVRVASYAILSAAMLYTHLGGVLILGAEAALLARDRWRGLPVLSGCVGLAGALVLFAPIAPAAFAELHSATIGHRFDWIGSAHQTSLALEIGLSMMAAAVGLILVFGPVLRFDRSDANGFDRREPMRWCAIWSLLPLLVLLMGSLLLHPMLEIRYVAPATAGFAILAAAALNLAGVRVRNLAATAIVAIFLAVAIPFHLYHQPFQLWRQIAHVVMIEESPSQVIFFEAGAVMGLRQAAGLDPDSLSEILPDGYLRIPFDYYFDGPNPQRTINPFRPSLARETIAQSARRDGGAWLVSHLDDEDLEDELPPRDSFTRSRIIYDPSVSVSLYHIVLRDQGH